MRHLDHVPRAVVGLQHGPNFPLHVVRFQDAKDPGELQRGQVHRLHNVQHVHHLASIHSNLLRHSERLRGKKLDSSPILGRGSAFGFQSFILLQRLVAI